MIHGNGNAVFIGYIPIIQQGLRPLSWPCMSPKSFYCIDSVWYFGVHEGRFACKLRGGDVVTFADDSARFHRLASFVLWQSISMIRGMHSLLFALQAFIASNRGIHFVSSMFEFPATSYEYSDRDLFYYM